MENHEIEKRASEFFSSMLKLPARWGNGEIVWRRQSYATLHRRIVNPAYGGGYAYRKTTVEPGHIGARPRPRIRRKLRDEWFTPKPGTHVGHIEWERAEAIRKTVGDNVPASRHHGAPKHGDPLLAGLLRCRRCSRKLTVSRTAHASFVLDALEHAIHVRKTGTAFHVQARCAHLSHD